MAKKKDAGPTPVDSIKHRDTRKNIPTEELRDFVAAEEAAPRACCIRAIRRSTRNSCGRARTSRTPPRSRFLSSHYGDEVLKVYDV